jgi:acetoacetyl-CoA synthetase
VDDSRGALLWSPVPGSWEASRVGRFAAWLERRGHHFDSYDPLWAWSVDDPDAFWSAYRDYADLGDAAGGGPALASRRMPGAEWFPGSTWNYAAEALRHDVVGPAVVAHSQTRPPVELSIEQLRDEVARCRAGLRRLGVRRGDRVAAYLPNIPEALIGLLASASLGAVWTSAPPEFGVRAVVDRFSQVAPVVLLAVEGYRYGDRRIDRRGHLADLRRQLPTVRSTVVVPYPDVATSGDGLLTWQELLGAEAPPADHEPVPFDHPLYILYSSGTTGRPKAIVHGHGGIVCEHSKVLSLHHDLGVGDRFFWFSTTGWMMWNYLISGLLVGAGVVLFDGDPSTPDLGALWRLAADTGVTFLGLSAPFLDACRRGGVEPPASGRLRGIGSTGAPLSAAAATWATGATGTDLPVSSVSGGTDLCTAFVGGTPVLPVRAGEISCRYLGAKAEAWVGGRPVVGRRGELVLAAPMPSMPVGLWGDADGSRLRRAYYEQNPGVWTHGDWVTFHADGSCVISGRADATLNRGGVRLGTAEIYAVVEELPEVADSLVVHLDAAGTDELVLFVALAGTARLDEGLRRRIRDALRQALSPRHAPDRIEVVPEIPRTLSGKKLEVPVKRILQGGAPEEVASRETLGRPEALDHFVALASAQGAREPT